MKRLILCLLVLTLIFSDMTFIASAEGMTTYENLSALEDDFIVRFKSVGITDEQLRAFLDDLDSYVDGFQSSIYMQDLDEYFITVLLQTMQKEEHIPILIAFDATYQEEIVYMLEYRKVPQNMTNFKMMVFSDKLIFEVDDESGKGSFMPDESFSDEGNNDYQEPSLPEVELPFDDIKEHIWAVESIVYLYENGVVNGTDERIFSPDSPVTREEFLKMIVEALLKTDLMYDREFGLRGQGKWYQSYLAAAEFYALIQGIYDESEFKDEVYLTRQDMCAIAYRAALRADISLPDKKYSTDFIDMNTFTYYSIQAIKELQEADIIHGTGNNMFEPYSTTTRAEAAKIIHSLMLLK